jgi:hypothetical protein
MLETEGSTLNLLKRGGKAKKNKGNIAKGKNVQQTIVNVNVGKSASKQKLPSQPNYRIVKQEPLVPSLFGPSVPSRLIPPQFQLAEGAGLKYANQPIVSRDVGNNAIQNGSNAYTAGAPNAANQGQYNSLPAFNQLDDMYRQGYVSQRLIPTMDMNAPRNSAIVSGNIPPVKSDPVLGTTGPRSESETTKAMKPETRTVHLHNVAAIASARNMGQNPVNAMAAAAAASSGISQLRSAHSAGMKAYFNELGQSVEEVPAASSKSGKRETRILPGGPGSSRVMVIEEEDKMRRGGRRFM